MRTEFRKSDPTVSPPLARCDLRDDRPRVRADCGGRDPATDVLVAGQRRCHRRRALLAHRLRDRLRRSHSARKKCCS